MEEMDVEWSEKLVHFFEEMLAFYKEFLVLEQKKYTVLLSGELGELDNCIKREQAFTLKARGMECDRKELLQKAGASESSFRELIPETDLSWREDMGRLYRRISDTVEEIRATNEKCAKITKIKLGAAARVVSGTEKDPELKKIYGEKTQSGNEERTFFSEKI